MYPMSHQERVKIVEVWKVQPTETLTIPTPKPLPLTLFDLCFLRLPLVKRVYFFNKSSSNVIPRLRYSLSLTLRHFLPLAGNIFWPGSSTIPFLRYLKGDGVSFSVAEPSQDLSFKVLSSSDNGSQTAAFALVPDLAISSEKAAVAAVQVTIFPGEGFSIGLTLNHAVLDGRSVQMFIKSWAHICRFLDSEGFSPLLLPAELRPFFDRTDVQDPRGIGESFTREWMSLGGPGNRSLVPIETKPSEDLVRRTFTLTRQDIEKIRLIVPSPIRRSMFSLASAYLWVCRVKAEGIYSDDSNAMFGFAGDLRSRIEPPLPMNYCGNCVVSTIAVAKAKELAADWRVGLGSALNSISESMKKLKGDDLMVGAMDWLSQWATYEGNLCFVAGSSRYGAYAADFGWGQPVKTDVISLDSARAILVQDAREGDGIEFRMSLEKPRMDAFASLFRQGLESF